MVWEMPFSAVVLCRPWHQVSSCWQPSLLAIAPLLGLTPETDIAKMWRNLFKMGFNTIKSIFLVRKRYESDQLSTRLSVLILGSYLRLFCFTAQAQQSFKHVFLIQLQGTQISRMVFWVKKSRKLSSLQVGSSWVRFWSFLGNLWAGNHF